MTGKSTSKKTVKKAETKPKRQSAKQPAENIAEGVVGVSPTKEASVSRGKKVAKEKKAPEAVVSNADDVKPAENVVVGDAITAAEKAIENKETVGLPIDVHKDDVSSPAPEPANDTAATGPSASGSEMKDESALEPKEVTVNAGPDIPAPVVAMETDHTSEQEKKPEDIAAPKVEAASQIDNAGVVMQKKEESPIVVTKPEQAPEIKQPVKSDETSKSKQAIPGDKEEKPLPKENGEKQFFKKASDKMMHIFNRRSAGVDISDRSIEVVEVKKNGNGYDINSGRVVLEPGIVERGGIVDKEKLKAKFLEALNNAKPDKMELTDVVFALPDCQVYTHIFSTPFKDQEELKAKVASEVETSIPIPFDGAVFSHKVLVDNSKNKAEVKGSEILVAVVSGDIARQWRDFFTGLDINIASFEIEPYAYYRGLFLNEVDSVVCIVDMGARNSTISVVSRDDVFCSFSVPVGGDVLTQKVLDESVLTGNVATYEEAEKAVRVQGFVPENPYLIILKNNAQLVIDEIMTAIKVGEARSKKEIKDVVIIGGTSSMNGLVSYMAEKIKKEPPVNVYQGQIGKAVGKSLPVEYVEAFGLAWMSANSDNTSKISLPAKIEEKKQEESKKKTETPVVKVSTSGKDRKKDKEAEEDPTEKTKKQLKILVALIVVGVIATGGSFWVKKQRTKNKKLPPVEMVQPELSYQHDVDLEIVVSVATSTKDLVATSTASSTVVSASSTVETVATSTTSDVSGDILTDIATQSMAYNDVIQQSLGRVKVFMKPGHTIWSEPIKIFSPKDKLIFPVRIDWFSYPEMKVSEYTLDKLNKKMGDNKYAFNSSQVKSVVYDEKNKTVILKIIVSIMTSSPEL